jgi:hypothetical protein
MLRPAPVHETGTPEPGVPVPVHPAMLSDSRYGCGGMTEAGAVLPAAQKRSLMFQ